MTKLIAEKPWILIIMGFLLLISVWVFFFVVAHHNQPERIHLSQAIPSTSSFIPQPSSFTAWT